MSYKLTGKLIRLTALCLVVTLNTSAQTLHYSKPAEFFEEASVIGNGTMGGIIYGLLKFDNDRRSLEFATAASCLKHTLKGDFNWVTVQDVEILMNGDISGRVKR